METTEDRHTSETQPIRIRKLSGGKAPTPADSGIEAEPRIGAESGIEADPRIGAESGIEAEPPDAGRNRTVERRMAQDRIPTPLPLEPPTNGGDRGSTRSRSSCALWVVLGFCLVISVASLVLNAVLITNLLAVRQTFGNGVDQAIAGLENLELNGFHYDYHFQQTIPFSGDIPFQQNMVFPFKGTVPIKTTVQVPIDAGILGKFTLDVPIDTSIPVDIEVPVEISQTFHVDTEIPIDMVIPIEISPDDPEIERLLDGLRDWLVAVREML